MVKYSEKLKQSMAAKILQPNGRSALSLAAETGISQSTLSKWAREYKRNGKVAVSDIQRRPKDWSKPEKFEAVVECAKLSGPGLGEYLRKNGLTTQHLEKWKKEFITGEESRSVGRPAKDPEVKKLEEELKLTKRDLRKKDKALAEASALLILKKKAQEIWGTQEDEE